MTEIKAMHHSKKSTPGTVYSETTSRVKKGVLLVNLGTPDSPSTADVRKYLREFLMDKRVIDIPYVFRWMLVNLIIAPFRAPKSAADYKELWEERGSPLKFYGEDITHLLQDKLGPNYVVRLAMRYQNPSIKEGLESMMAEGVQSIKVISLFPQYASATTGSVADKVMEIVSKWQIIPDMQFVNQFVEHPLFIETIRDNALKLLAEKKYEHFVFSYHGVPERHIKKGSVGKQCQLGICCNTFHDKNRYCYRAQCFLTTRLLVKALGLKEGEYTTTFQSRLGKDPWIQPYAEDTIKMLGEKGIKNVMVFSPAFISDCLETTLEVGEEFKEYFEKAGGEVWDLVPSLNDSPKFVDCLEDLVRG